jgi:hypothetical protein
MKQTKIDIGKSEDQHNDDKTSQEAEKLSQVNFDKHNIRLRKRVGEGNIRAP